jgi:excisionase family DNA binding protein
MLTGAQVRERLGIGKEKFLELVKTGELAAIKLGSAPNAPYRISEEALDDFIERSRVVPRERVS